MKQRLLSTSSFTTIRPPNNLITVCSTSWTVAPNPNDASGIDVFISPVNNLLVSTGHNHNVIQQTASLCRTTVSAIHWSNFNLNEPWKELLCWHCRLGHVGCPTIQFLFCSGVLATSERIKHLHAAAAKVIHHNLPCCAACAFGRWTNCPNPSGRKSRAICDKVGILSANQTQPGQRVFADHFISSTLGCREHLELKGQTQHHSGASSHHMNGKAERAIQTITAMTRTQMLSLGLQSLTPRSGH